MSFKKIYGLIGFPLGHSFSRKYFTDKFAEEGITDAEYRNCPIEDISLFPKLLKENSGIRGLNVTIPYKESVIPYLDSLDKTAAEIGAVNCISIGADGKLTGHNTDAYGFRNSLLRLIGNERPKALVLGTGGASKAVKYVLSELGIDLINVSRKAANGRISYEEVTAEIMDTHRLIVNCTPLGTFPDTDSYPPIPYEYLTENHYLFDLVYNPPQTAFLAKGKYRGGKIINGYGMLKGQAEKAWEIWQGSGE